MARRDREDTGRAEEARCEFCFEPRNGRKMLKRHAFSNGTEFHGYVCDVRCGELWQKQMKEDYQKGLRVVGF